MIQGKEFIDIEHNFLEHVKMDIGEGTFDTLLLDTGLTEAGLMETLQQIELYDGDYLDIDGELKADKLFPDPTIRDAALRALGIVEVLTVRIPSRTAGKEILFMAIGESLTPEEPYTCYAYGFIVETESGGEEYYFECLAKIV